MPCSQACLQPLLEKLDELCSRPWTERLEFVRRIAEQVARLHERGVVHRNIVLESLLVDDQFDPRLPEPPASRRFGGDADLDFCPPDLAGARAVDLPADAAVAARLLEKSGQEANPQRIDIYQLGTLLCRLLTGHTIRDYMVSPTVKSLVPSPARRCLAMAIGFDADERYEDCGRMIAEIDELLQEAQAAPAPPGTADTWPPGQVGAWGSTAVNGSGCGTGPVRSERAEPLPFQRLGPFEILERIGAGGMGDVYKGYDETLQRIVAVKVLPPELARSADLLERFRCEASAVARLNHPNIVPIYYVGEDDQRHFFAMQYIEGESLAEWLERQGGVSLTEALKVLEQCLAGLEATHAQGLVHRDITPANILIERATGRAVLIDFGLVRRMDGAARLTTPGAIMGTADYLAPEQARGRQADHRADLYAVGVLMYQLLAGRLPFSGDTATSVIFQHAHEHPQPLGALVPDLPPALVCMVERLLEKAPARRYQTAGEVLAELHAIGQTQGASNPPTDHAQQEAKVPGIAPSAKADGRLRRFSMIAHRPGNRMALGVGLTAVVVLAVSAAWLSAPGATATVEDPAKSMVVVGRGERLPEAEWVDVLRVVDPSWDAVSGRWYYRGTDLTAGPEPFSRLMLPVELQGSYDLEFEFTRLTEHDWPTGLIFPVGSRACLLYLDAWQVHGLERINGRMVEDRLNPAVRRPSILLSGQRYAVTVAVRLEGDRAKIDVTLDGEPLVSWSGRQESLDVASWWRLPNPLRPALLAHGAAATYHVALVRVVSGESRMTTRPQPPAVDLDDPQWADLLAGLDLERDTIHGRWRQVEDGVAVAPAAQDDPFVRLMLPHSVEGSYDLMAEFTRTLGADSVTFTLPVGARQCTLHLSAASGQIGGLERIDGLAIGSRYNPAVRRPSALVNGRRYQVLAQVRTDGKNASVAVWFDGKPFVQWAGCQDLLSLDCVWMLPEAWRVGLGANRNNVTFHTVRMRSVAQEIRQRTEDP